MRSTLGRCGRLARLSLCVALVSAVPTRAAPQDSSKPPGDRFEEAIEVQVVNLEVVVTDEAGERVPSVPRQSFVVRVDGEEVPILYFSEIAGPAAENGEVATAAETAVNFLVFVDDYVSLKRNRDFTLDRLRRELPQLGANDRMAIVAYDGRRLRTLSSWSGSVDVLDAALAAAIERPATGIKWVALGRMPYFIANWIGNATRRSILAAASSMRLLPEPVGRKVMLLVAGSWDPVEVATAANFSPWCLSDPCSGVFVYTALTDAANQLGYSIYSVDVEGRDVQGDWGREMRLEGILEQLAVQTGGRALLNTERKRMLEIASADSRSYYSIGIQPVDSEPNSRHWIEVDVLEPGLEARTQGSFVAVSERRDRDLETLGTLLTDVETARPEFPVELGAPERLGRGRMRLPVSVFVPLGELTWIASKRGYEALFEIGLATMDGFGNSEHESWEIGREEASVPDRADVEHLEFDLELRRRRHTLAVTIRDLHGDHEYSTVVPVDRGEDDRNAATKDEATERGRAGTAPGR